MHLLLWPLNSYLNFDICAKSFQKLKVTIYFALDLGGREFESHNIFNRECGLDQGRIANFQDKCLMHQLVTSF